MPDLVLHVAVDDETAAALIPLLEAIVDDEEDRGQWRLWTIGMPEVGAGGTIPHRLPVRLDSFGVDDDG